MDVERGKAAAKSMYEGESYYFCSAECQKEFETRPDRYSRQPASSR
jgi:YHS domain-containing protein